MMEQPDRDMTRPEQETGSPSVVCDFTERSPEIVTLERTDKIEPARDAPPDTDALVPIWHCPETVTVEPQRTVHAIYVD